MRAELLTGEQEKELAVMVQDLLSLEAVFKELAASLGRAPTDEEWMEAAGAADSSADRLEALSHFMSRLSLGRNAKQVGAATTLSCAMCILATCYSYNLLLRLLLCHLECCGADRCLGSYCVLTVELDGHEHHCQLASDQTYHSPH